ncbi:Sec20-domain-containing protein [Zopfochytrium polystomum]|nr:Sec20-domain-containing protein [Zopfochytrium polystomum]
MASSGEAAISDARAALENTILLISAVSTNGTIGTEKSSSPDIQSATARMRDHLISLASLRIQAEDEPNPVESQRLISFVDREEKLAKMLQVKLRQAVLVAKADQDRAALRDRESLLANGRSKKKQTAFQTGAELTESLRQAVQMMATEVERSAAAVSSLNDSTILLDTTKSQYTTFQSVMKVSGGLLSQLHRQSLLDRFILFFGLFIFLATVGYIFWKRMWFLRFDRLLYSTKGSPTVTTQTVISTATSLLTSTLTSGGVSATETAQSWHRDEL